MPPTQAPATREGPKEGTPFSGASQPSSAEGAHQQVKQGAGGYQRGSSQGPQGGQRQENSDNQRLFVGNLPHGCTEEDLNDLFSKFGRVLEVRINRRGQGREAVPNFGFIVFEDAASVARTLSAKPILLYGNHR